MAQLLQPKQQLAGYEIGELVGKGGMGEVYRARQISMDRVVALKILAPRLAKQDPIFAKRFVDEARAAGRLNHPNIIAVHDVGKAPMPGSAAGTEPDLDYFSMEYVDGESVKDVIERQGICPLSLVAQVMQGMTEALVYAEAQGIVHRDIKPDNIMITNGGVVKLADLGLALQLGGEEVIGEKDGQGRSKVMGTPLYMSPEQARALPVDSRSDQYSLGATLFHMLTGRPPFKGDNAKVIMRSHVFDPVPDPKTFNPEVPEGWRQLAMRLLAKTPEERFQNAIAMRAAMQAAISGHGNPGISRRVRTSGFANAKERAASMPQWAKYLVYGFAAAVVAMVVAFSIPWGGSKKDVKPPDDPLTVKPDPQVEAQKLLERVKGRISALPVDHEKAIAQIDELAQDKSIPVGPARDLLERERAARVTSLNEQKRKEEERLLAEKARERQARTIELEQAWGAGDLPKVKECIDYLSTEVDKLSPSARDRLATIRSKFGVALVDLQKDLTDEAMQAQTVDELKAMVPRVDASPLAAETKTTIKTIIIKRAVELAPAKPEQPVDDRERWQALGTQLDSLRGGMTYGEIARLADKEAAGFPTTEARTHVQGIAALARLAAKAEGALRVYVADANPLAEITFNSKPTRAKLHSLDEKVGFTLQEGGADAEMKQDRRNVSLPLRQLVEKALEDSAIAAAERPVMVAAMLWVWRHPEAPAVFATIPAHPLTKAVQELERKTRLLDLQAKIVRTGDQAAVTYDGSKSHPWFITDFVGTGAQAGAQGLTWGTSAAVQSKGRESDIPTLRWKQALHPPFTLTAQVLIAPRTHLALIGVTTGQRTIRLGFNTNRAQHSCVALQTKGDGEGFELVKNYCWVGMLKLDAPQKAEIRVDADYRVTLRFNDTALGEPLQLPAGSTITPVFQVVQLEELATAFTLTSLLVSGNLTPAE
jgi:serine/threonine protein kinase